MDHLPTSQEYPHGSLDDWGEPFALPAPRKLPRQMHWKCAHCGAANSSAEATLYHWPDRPRGKRAGYVVCCRQCGCRGQLIVGKQPQRPPVKPQPSNKVWIVALVFALLLALIAAVALLKHNSMLPDAGKAPGGDASPASSASASASASSSEAPPEPEPEPEEDMASLLTSMRLGPVPEDQLSGLPDHISTKEWDTKRVVQGLEWNTDTMDTIYFSVAHYVAACRPNGTLREETEKTKGYYFSLDYYNGHLFCTWRSDSFGRFKLKVLDPVTLDEEKSVSLTDMHKQFEQDKKDYGSKLCASIDGIVVAPRIGTQDELMIYVSYNSYVSKENGMALNNEQTIYEYSYEEALDPSIKKLIAQRRMRVDLGEVQYGIQTLELDRSTGNIWCAIRQGYSDYSLYLIDGKSKGSNLSVIPNGSQSGWDCPAAADGLCSLGHDEFYLLIPDYKKKEERVSVEARWATLDQLEGFK